MGTSDESQTHPAHTNMVKIYTVVALAASSIGMVEAFGRTSASVLAKLERVVDLTFSDEGPAATVHLIAILPLAFRPLRDAVPALITTCPTALIGRKKNRCGDHGALDTVSWATAGRCICDKHWEGNCCNKFRYVGKCTIGMEHLCRFNEEENFEISDMIGSDEKYAGPISVGTRAHGLPETMQGIFWLKDQGDSTAMISFAPSRDGAGLSEWVDGKISIRLGGDNIVATAKEDKYMFVDAREKLDLVYDLIADNATNPTKFEITVRSPLVKVPLLKKDLSGPLVDYSMELMKTTYPATETRPAAVQWMRNNSYFITGDNSKSAFELAQIIDGDGKPTSAFDDFKAYYEPDGNTPWKTGRLNYYSVDEIADRLGWSEAETSVTETGALTSSSTSYAVSTVVCLTSALFLMIC